MQAFADARVAREVERRETGIGFVPDLRGDLVVAVGVLEAQFVLGTIKDHPARARIAEAVAEDDVQPPADLVDEIVYVGVAGGVVVGEGELRRFDYGEDTERGAG